MANHYVSQNSAAAADGSSLANTWGVTDFNTSSNWSSTPGTSGKISPGDTVILNGTISSRLLVQGSGSSGNIITILFATGAIMSAATWGGHSALSIAGNSYITVDGGATGTIGGYYGNPTLSNGIIENTSNGTLLATQNNDTGIACQDCTNILIKGLIIRNIYVQINNCTDAQVNVSLSYGQGFSNIYNGGTASNNIKVTNCIIHDVQNGVFFDYAPSSNTFEMSFCTAYNCNWGGAAGDHGSTSAITGLSVHDNYFYNWESWTSTGANARALFHHNGFYAYAASNGSLANVNIYNNFCGPGFDSVQSTAGIFLYGKLIGTGLIYNNILVADASGNAADASIFAWIIGGGANSVKIYNNTIVGVGNGAGIEVYSGNSDGSTTYDIKNNLVSGMATAITWYYNTFGTLTADYNIGYGLLNGQQYSSSSNSSSAFKTFTQWQGLGFDLHGNTGNPNLNSNYIPQSPSSANGSGIDLSNYFTTDFSGVSRIDPWWIGALVGNSIFTGLIYAAIENYRKFYIAGNFGGGL
jgi:hypothetical protein